MGTGKSSVGREVATELGFEFVDTDALIEHFTGKSIPKIFAEDGEMQFRNFETEILARLEGKEKTVIATGGGALIRTENQNSLKRHSFIVCLWATPEAIWERVRSNAHRPLLIEPDPLQKIKELLAAREVSYRSADALVNTESRSIKEVAQNVLLQFRTAPRFPQ